MLSPENPKRIAVLLGNGQEPDAVLSHEQSPTQYWSLPLNRLTKEYFIGNSGLQLYLQRVEKLLPGQVVRTDGRPPLITDEAFRLLREDLDKKRKPPDGCSPIPVQQIREVYRVSDSTINRALRKLRAQHPQEFFSHRSRPPEATEKGKTLLEERLSRFAIPEDFAPINVSQLVNNNNVPENTGRDIIRSNPDQFKHKRGNRLFGTEEGSKLLKGTIKQKRETQQTFKVIDAEKIAQEVGGGTTHWIVRRLLHKIAPLHPELFSKSGPRGAYRATSEGIFFLIGELKGRKSKADVYTQPPALPPILPQEQDVFVADADRKIDVGGKTSSSNVPSTRKERSADVKPAKDREGSLMFPDGTKVDYLSKIEKRFLELFIAKSEEQETKVTLEDLKMAYADVTDNSAVSAVKEDNIIAIVKTLKGKLSYIGSEYKIAKATSRRDTKSGQRPSYRLVAKPKEDFLPSHEVPATESTRKPPSQPERLEMQALRKRMTLGAIRDILSSIKEVKQENRNIRVILARHLPYKTKLTDIFGEDVESVFKKGFVETISNFWNKDPNAKKDPLEDELKQIRETLKQLQEQNYTINGLLQTVSRSFSLAAA